MIKLSAVIITFNEALNIERCLKSLIPVVDEIVLRGDMPYDDQWRSETHQDSEKLNVWNWLKVVNHRPVYRLHTLIAAEVEDRPCGWV